VNLLGKSWKGLDFLFARKRVAALYLGAEAMPQFAVEINQLIVYCTV